jgi:hypothetical protein
MSIVRFLWLAISPIRKTEEIAGVLSLLVTLLVILGVVGAGFVGWLAPSPLPQPSPRWPLIVAYPTVILAVLFFIAGVRLQCRLSKNENAKVALPNKAELIKSIHNVMTAAIRYITIKEMRKKFERDNSYESSERDKMVVDAYNTYKNEKDRLEQEILVAGEPFSKHITMFVIYVNIHTPDYLIDSEFDYEEIRTQIRERANTAIIKIHSMTQ